MPFTPIQDIILGKLQYLFQSSGVVDINKTILRVSNGTLRFSKTIKWSRNIANNLIYANNNKHDIKL